MTNPAPSDKNEGFLGFSPRKGDFETMKCHCDRPASSNDTEMTENEEISSEKSFVLQECQLQKEENKIKCVRDYLMSEEHKEQQKNQRRAAASESEPIDYDEENNINEAPMREEGERGSIADPPSSPRQNPFVSSQLDNGNPPPSWSCRKFEECKEKHIDIWQLFLEQKDKEDNEYGNATCSSSSTPRRASCASKTSSPTYPSQSMDAALISLHVQQFLASRLSSAHTYSLESQQNQRLQEWSRHGEDHSSNNASSASSSARGQREGKVQENDQGKEPSSQPSRHHNHNHHTFDASRNESNFPLPPPVPFQGQAPNQYRASMNNRIFHTLPSGNRGHDKLSPLYHLFPPLNKANLPTCNQEGILFPRSMSSIDMKRANTASAGGRKINFQSCVFQPSFHPLPAAKPILPPQNLSAGKYPTVNSMTALAAPPLRDQQPSSYSMQPHSNRQILALSTPDDENWLSEFLCFVRSDCVEVFTATEGDVASRMNSKKVLLDQVGIRCRFCAHISHRDRAGRSSSFPSSLSRIYQSLTMMLRDHFPKCHMMPHEVKDQYLALKANTSQGATDSKKYWVESAKSLGLVDTEEGIRFMNESTCVAVASSTGCPTSSAQH